MNYIGTLSYTELNEDRIRVDRFEPQGDLIVLDWTSEYIETLPGAEGDTVRLLGVAERQVNGEFECPWIQLSGGDESHYGKVTFSFDHVDNGMLKLTGIWHNFGDEPSRFTGFLDLKAGS